MVKIPRLLAFRNSYLKKEDSFSLNERQQHVLQVSISDVIVGVLQQILQV